MDAIRQTIASYTYFADRGRFDDAAEMFATDGVLEIEGIGGARLEGRAAIKDYFAGVVANADPAAAPPGRMQHHVSSTWIEVTSPTEARAASYFTVMTGAGVDHWGRYRDTFTLVDGQWLFAHRHVTTDGITPGGWADNRRQ